MNHIPHRIPWNLDVSLRTYQSNVHGFFALFAIHLNSSRWLCLRFAHFRFQDVCDCCQSCWRRRRQQWLWRSHEYISKMFTEDKFHLNSIFSARSSWLCEMEGEEKQMEGIGEARAKCASCVRGHVRFAVITLARQFRVKYFSFLLFDDAVADSRNHRKSSQNVTFLPFPHNLPGLFRFISLKRSFAFEWAFVCVQIERLDCSLLLFVQKVKCASCIFAEFYCVKQQLRAPGYDKRRRGAWVLSCCCYYLRWLSADVVCLCYSYEAFVVVAV